MPTTVVVVFVDRPLIVDPLGRLAPRVVVGLALAVDDLAAQLALHRHGLATRTPKLPSLVSPNITGPSLARQRDVEIDDPAGPWPPWNRSRRRSEHCRLPSGPSQSLMVSITASSAPPSSVTNSLCSIVPKWLPRRPSPARPKSRCR